MEWSREAEIFIICIYIVIPALVIGAVFTGLILLVRNLIRARNKRRKENKPQ